MLHALHGSFLAASPPPPVSTLFDLTLLAASHASTWACTNTEHLGALAESTVLPDAGVQMVNKNMVLRNKMTDYVRNERTILDCLTHEGIVKLLFTFQDADSLCECVYKNEPAAATGPCTASEGKH